MTKHTAKAVLEFVREKGVRSGYPVRRAGSLAVRLVGRLLLFP